MNPRPLTHRKIKRKGYRQARNAAIIEAATREFLEHGFHHATLARIVKKAGGSLSTIYSLFQDKAGLFAAVLDSVGDHAMEWPISIDGPGTPEKILEQFGTHYLHSCLAPKAIALHRLVTSEAAKFPETGEIVFYRVYRVISASLAKYLRERTEAGELDVPKPDVAANIFLGAVTGEFHLRALFDPTHSPNAAEIKKHIRETVRLFLIGVGTRPGQIEIRNSAGASKPDHSKRPLVAKKNKRGPRSAI